MLGQNKSAIGFDSNFPIWRAITNVVYALSTRRIRYRYPVRISGMTSKNKIATPMDAINMAGHVIMDTRSLKRTNPKLADATGNSDAITKASYKGGRLNPKIKKTDP